VGVGVGLAVGDAVAEGAGVTGLEGAGVGVGDAQAARRSATTSAPLPTNVGPADLTRIISPHTPPQNARFLDSERGCNR
jgi:hypothetical protein